MSEYSVDLSALDQVVKRLNGLVDTMDGVGKTAEYKTDLPAGWLGKDFDEERQLRNAHAEMKKSIAGMVAELKDLMNDFGTKTHTVRNDYEASDQAVADSMK